MTPGLAANQDPCWCKGLLSTAIYCYGADEQQIEYVTAKVSMVETMHDGLRLAMASLRTDVHDGKDVLCYAGSVLC